MTDQAPPPPAADAGPLDRWFAERRTLVLVVTLLLALGVRGLALLELGGGALLHLHEWQESDMSFFHEWGKELADGDWLIERPLHPHHGWHAEDAAEHFAAHPDELARLSDEASREGLGRTPAELLWDRWYGGNRFHQEPLYPYLVGLTYAVFGPEPRAVFAWQIALALGSLLLVRRLAGELFGEAAAGIAGLLFALNAPLAVYDFVLLRATPLTFVSLALAWLATRALRRETARDWLVTGLVAGLALMLKMTFALFGAGLGLWLLWTRRARLGSALRPLGFLAAGTLIALLPAIARNVVVGAPATSLSSVGAVGILSANAEDTSDRPQLSLGSEHLPRIFAETDRGMLTTYVAALKTHDSLASYAARMTRRFLFVWHGFEIPNNVSVDHFRSHAWSLRLLPISFVLLAPLSLVGLWMARRRPQAAALAWMALANVPSLVAFGILSRYRTPMMAALIPFAALALVQLIEQARARRFVALALPALLVATSVAADLAHPPRVSRIRLSDHVVPLQVFYQPRIAEAENDPARAAQWVGRALRHVPSEIRGLDASHRATTERERTLAGVFSQVYAAHGRFLQQAGRHDEAARAIRRAEALAAAANAP